MNTQQPGSIEIFYAFAPEDSKFANRLKKHLAPMQRKYQITNWHEQDIPPGQEIDQQINKHLNAAYFILLFISPDFLASDNLQAIVSRAMERREAENVQVIPILTRPVHLESTEFHKFQCLPTNKEPISIWKLVDAAYVHIAEELHKVIENGISTSLSQTSASPARSAQPVIEHILENKEAPQSPEERHIVIYLESIQEGKHPEPAHHKLPWKKYFVLEGSIGGHQLKDPKKWHTTLPRELHRLQEEIRHATDCRLLRVYGASRICCWFAFGYTFRETTGYTIKQKQGEQVWSTRALPNQEFLVRVSGNGDPTGEPINTEGDTVALGISVNTDLEGGVRTYLAGCPEKVAALLLIQPERELGTYCLQGAEDAMALAESVKNYARNLVNHWNAKKLLLFYAGPVAGATFIGYKLNATGAPIQIIEYHSQERRYIPTFLLTF